MGQHHEGSFAESDDLPFLHPAGMALAVLTGATVAGLVACLGVWLATPLVGVGAAAILVGILCLAAAMLMPRRPRRARTGTLGTPLR
ncbi:hypothetical protein CBI38_09610 [Rhodococcus oxybenzonivorans]|uniref:Uncharacterized protein n=1 Tax=Rhodococcus oxybenzonivorans TaxID=1990687 RepID=A0A2S2BT55_9NOCA|nr:MULTISPECIES: hypothetical protein [Rhodococcus]AWK71810.1 hypothetical protein CBI38_09610 [Rhodococcus oxybenzonivorans]